jgi:sterol 3beta-glucosyltransferase
MTHLLMLTAGSRGDVQPFIALGRRLQAEGYEVTLAAGAMFQGLVESYGVPFAPLDDEILRLKDTPAGQRAIEGQSSLSLMKRAMPMLRRMVDDAWTAAEHCGADAVIFHPKTLAGMHIAEARRIPAIMALTMPFMHATAVFPNPALPVPGLSGFTNRLSYQLTPLMSAAYGGVTSDWRKSRGLPGRSRFRSDAVDWQGEPTPTLVMVSEHVLPRPAEWPSQVIMTGYWMLDDAPGWQPPADLAAFLNAGDAPVYIGFGSMTGTKAAERARIAIEALQASGLRGVLATGWGGLNPSHVPDTVHVLKETPHSWLFPRMAAVVHHGGAGTTAAGLMAGKPTLVVPFFGDQPFWGQRVEALGVGPAPIPQKKLTANNLAQALRELNENTTMRERAEVLGRQLRAEDGTAIAVNHVRQWVSEPTPEQQRV